jgi:cell division initiation protein
MKLTPLDIRHKEFARSMRGYKDLEVDEFLDDIADEFERLFNENIDYKERLESLEEKIEQYKNIEETLKKTLVSAQQQAEEMKQNAKKEADLILRDAELKARSILNDSYAERQKIQRSVQALKQKQEDLRYQMRSVLETYMNILDQEGDVVSGDVLEGAEASETLAATASAPASPLKTGKLPEGVEAAVSSEAVPDTDVSGAASDEAEAVSTELFGEEKPTASADDAAAGTAAAAAGSEEEKGQPHSRPADPAVKSYKEDEDPFADVEMDTDENKFKW